MYYNNYISIKIVTAKYSGGIENIKKERGLADFRVQLSSDPEEIDRNELRGKIFLKPVPSLEFIILEFNVTSTGASFDDI